MRKGAQYGLVELTFLPEERELIKLAALDIYPEEGAVVLTQAANGWTQHMQDQWRDSNDVTFETGGRDFD